MPDDGAATSSWGAKAGCMLEDSVVGGGNRGASGCLRLLGLLVAGAPRHLQCRAAQLRALGLRRSSHTRCGG